MDQTILQTLFLDNLEIPAELAKFCDTIPEYVQAEQAFKQAARKLEACIVYERYNRFELILAHHLACEVRASYLFGLGLRREILRGMTG